MLLSWLKAVNHFPTRVAKTVSELCTEFIPNFLLAKIFVRRSTNSCLVFPGFKLPGIPGFFVIHDYFTFMAKDGQKVPKRTNVDSRNFWFEFVVKVLFGLPKFDLFQEFLVSIRAFLVGIFQTLFSRDSWHMCLTMFYMFLFFGPKTAALAH